MDNDKQLYDNVTAEVVEYLRPDLTGDTDADIGKLMGTNIVEGTAHFDAAVMAKWFMGNLVGPALHWIRYRMEERRYHGDDEMNAFLQRLADFMLEQVYAHPRSNFYEVNGPFVLDGLTTGSPVMLTEWDAAKQRNVCMLPHYTENYLMRDWFGDDVAYHREFRMTNFQAMQAFGVRDESGHKDYAVLPAEIRSEIKQGDYLAKHHYLMCIAQAGDRIFEDLQPQFQIPLTRPWMQLWFARDASQPEDKKPLNYQPARRAGELLLRGDGSQINMPTSSPGFWSRPFNPWHYNRLPHETYSRTPGWYSLPDVKGLDAAWRTVHETAQQAATPATMAVESLKTKLKLGAKGVTWIPDANWDKKPETFQRQAQYSWAMDFVDRRNDMVGRHFFRDMARMIDTYSREHTQPPTAYQLSQMISETLVLIGPAITSYAGPALQNIDDQFMESQLGTGRLMSETNPPDELFESSGGVAPVFTGPLLQGLRQAMLSKRIETPLMMAGPIFETAPESKQAVRWTDLVERILEGGDFPQDVIVPKEEREAAIAAIRAQQAQQQMIANMGEMANMVPQLQGETPDNSPLKAISEAAA
jgi:hypothetical protein